MLETDVANAGEARTMRPQEEKPLRKARRWNKWLSAKKRTDLVI